MGRVAGAFQPLTVLGEQLVVGVVPIRLGAEDDDAGANESADIVDVAVGVVAHDAPAEPDHLANAQAVGEGPLDLGSGEPRIARLLARQQAFLGREQRALAVDVDRPTLENDAPPRWSRASLAKSFTARTFALSNSAGTRFIAASMSPSLAPRSSAIARYSFMSLRAGSWIAMGGASLGQERL